MTIDNLSILIESITTNGRNRASKVREVLHAIKDEICKVNEVRYGFFTNTFITENFDSTGLGINSMDGFAICNGNNGTVDASRKVLVGKDKVAHVSGNNFTVIGNSFGAETHTLIESELPIININGHTVLAGTTAGGGSGFEPFNPGITDTIGGGLAHNNLQPSIVALIYQRIA